MTAGETWHENFFTSDELVGHLTSVFRRSLIANLSRGDAIDPDDVMSKCARQIIQIRALVSVLLWRVYISLIKETIEDLILGFRLWGFVSLYIFRNKKGSHFYCGQLDQQLGAFQHFEAKNISTPYLPFVLHSANFETAVGNLWNI